MDGPHHSLFSPIPPSEWERSVLVRGREYRIVKEFVDADGDQHHVGENWVFIGSAFSRYDGLVILMVQFPGGDEWKIPLLETSSAQHAVIQNFLEYVAPIGTNQP